MGEKMSSTITETISAFSKEELLTALNTTIERDETNVEIYSDEEKKAYNGIYIILEPIVFDFSETKFISFEKPLNLEQLEKEVFLLIKNNPDIETDSIIEKFKSNETWDILDILDKLKAKGRIE